MIDAAHGALPGRAERPTLATTTLATATATATTATACKLLFRKGSYFHHHNLLLHFRLRGGLLLMMDVDVIFAVITLGASVNGLALAFT